MGALRQSTRAVVERQGSGIILNGGLCLFRRREAMGFAHFPKGSQGDGDGYAQGPENLGAVGVVIGGGKFLPHVLFPFGRLLALLER